MTEQQALLEALGRLRELPHEDATVEFKSNLNNPAEIGEYLSALANSAALEGRDRAWMVWGVENVSHAIIGTSFDPFSAKGEGNQSLIMWLQQGTSPRADFMFHSCEHPNGRVVMLEIHPPRSAPIAFRTVRYNKARITKLGRVTRSALLLLGRDEAAHFLAPADAKITWVLRDATNRAVTSQHFGIPLLLSTEKVFARVRNVTIEHMPDGTLFPTAIPQYDVWVIREALHNCVAHQDYRLGGKINVVEHPDRLVFSNLGQFIPPSVEWMLEHQSPPEHYRNQWLIDGMIRLRMIDQIGSGIRRMFETQRERFFPLPDYTIDSPVSGYPRVELAIAGQILDIKYTLALMKRSDLDLSHVLLLDRIQRRRTISSEDARDLKALKLIEGRAPNYFISAKVAEWTGQRARYIHNRGVDDGYYRKLVTDYLAKYGQAMRKDIDDLLLSKMPDVLDADQKAHKVRNLLQAMRRDGVIHREGPKPTAVWRLGAGNLPPP